MKLRALKTTQVASAHMDDPEKDCPSTPPRKKRRVDESKMTPPPVKQPSPRDLERTYIAMLARLFHAVERARQYSSDSDSDGDTLVLGQQ